VLLHGFPEAWFGWRHQIPYLAARGYRVVAPDQRGYNLSDKPKARKAYRTERLTEDVVDIIDFFGAERAHVVGHDWGGIVAWAVAARFPDRLLRAAVLNAPHPAVFRRALATNPRQLRRSWYVFAFQLPRLAERALLKSRGGILRRTSNEGSFSDDDLARYAEAWQRPGAASAMVNWYRAAAFDKTSRTPIDVPLMVVWGVRDHALGVELAAQCLELCTRGRLELIEDATHWVQHDAPDRVNALLDEWLGAPEPT
jgi:pimeloyl-ACP methyl ester carboxylesterase